LINGLETAVGEHLFVVFINHLKISAAQIVHVVEELLDVSNSLGYLDELQHVEV
jgi:hypothetical protein